MENYTIVITANGDEAEAMTIAQSAVDAIKAFPHTLISARITIDKGGETVLE